MIYAHNKKHIKYAYPAKDHPSALVYNCSTQWTNYFMDRPDTECITETVLKFLPQYREDTSHLANGTDLVSNDFFPQVGSCTCI
jgi:hypothetical protein